MDKNRVKNRPDIPIRRAADEAGVISDSEDLNDLSDFRSSIGNSGRIKDVPFPGTSFLSYARHGQ